MKLPAKYNWLANIEHPAELKEALTHYGLLETKGEGDTVDIMRWAKEVGVIGWYPHDSVPWCGLFKGVCAKRSGGLDKPKYDLLSALSWLIWGTPVPKGQEMLGDTLIFSREGGGHVTYYVGENKTAFLCFGGNQSDAVGFAWVAKDRLMGCRRAKWKVSQPESVRKIILTDSGELSKNEV